MKKILRYLILVILLLLLMAGDTRSQDILVGRDHSFSFEVDTTDQFYAVWGEVSWNADVLQYISSSMDERFGQSVINDTEADSLGYVKMAWAGANPITVDSAIAQVVLRGKGVGPYEVIGRFLINANPDTVLYRYTGNGIMNTATELPDTILPVASLWPNPANPEVNLFLTTPEPQRISIKLFDVTGREVDNMFEGFVYDSLEIHYRTQEVASGLYLFAIQGKNFKIIKSFTILK